MIRLLPIVLLSVAPLLMAEGAAAQMVQDPTAWTYEVKKKTGNQYDLVFHLKLKEGWHIWSLKPGGDGYQISPSFRFDKNANVSIVGAVKESGKKTTTTMEGIDKPVSYLSGTIDYVQTVTFSGKGKITGKNGYQVCNDQLCLPPKDKPFEFDIK